MKNKWNHGLITDLSILERIGLKLTKSQKHGIHNKIEYSLKKAQT